MTKTYKIILETDEDFLLWRQASGTTVEIYDIQVGSKRNEGRGRRLVNKLMDERVPEGTTLIWAITRSSNFVAQQFYESLRFRVVGVLRDFYKQEALDPNSVDAIMYGRNVGTAKNSS